MNAYMDFYENWDEDLGEASMMPAPLTEVDVLILSALADDTLYGSDIMDIAEIGRNEFSESIEYLQQHGYIWQDRNWHRRTFYWRA